MLIIQTDNHSNVNSVLTRFKKSLTYNEWIQIQCIQLQFHRPYGSFSDVAMPCPCVSLATLPSPDLEPEKKLLAHRKKCPPFPRNISGNPSLVTNPACNCAISNGMIIYIGITYVRSVTPDWFLPRLSCDIKAFIQSLCLT